MKKIVLAALAAATMLSTPAAATDRSGYVGIEGGLLFARDENVGLKATDGSESFSLEGFETVSYKTGRDLDIVAGYDFGWLRAELELANKRAKHDGMDFFEFFGGGDDDITSVGYTRVNSVMLNALLDVSPAANVSLYAGPGIGWANTKLKIDAKSASIGDEVDVLDATIKDTSLALQAIAGIRFNVTPQLELGAKYRYFEAGKIRENGSDVFFCSEVDGAGCEIHSRFRSHSVLASLIYNFAAPVAPAPAPVLEPAPMPEPAPATQTCYDGSVILATDACPMPPAPPAPTPTPERG